MREGGGASVEVLVIGTEHFSSWDGPDDSHDILSNRRQEKLDQLPRHLAKFEPTKVAVELLASRQLDLDAWYQRFRGGEVEPDRNEVYQIGFRLAAHLDHQNVYAIDADWTLDWAAAKQYLEHHPKESPGEGLSPESARLVAEAQARFDSSWVSELLAHANDTDQASLNDREYLDRYLMIGAGDNWRGVALIASWYKRNLRIFANFKSIVKDSDRIVVVFGLGHVHSLKHFIATTSRFELVEPRDYLR